MTFNLRGVPVVLTSKTLRCGPCHATVAGHIETVELLVDRASIEVFVNRGELSLSRFVLFQENGLSLETKGGAVAIESLSVYPLHSAWKQGRGQ